MISSVKKAMDILNLLAENGENPVKLKTIAEKTAINKATCVHILDTLESGHYVEKVSRLDGYRISFGTFYLTRFGGYRHKISDVAHPVLLWLNKKTHKSTGMQVISNGKRVCIDYIAGDMPFSKNGENIIINGLYNASSGRLLLSFLNDFEIEETVLKYGLPKKEDWDIKDIDDMKRKLSIIRKNKFCETVFTIDGTPHCGYSMPIIVNGKCVAAVGIAGYSKATAEEQNYLKKAVTEIGRRLKFGGDK